jgi:hypothetical protein
MAQRERYGNEDYGNDRQRGGRGRWYPEDERGRYGRERSEYGHGFDYERRGRGADRDNDFEDESRFGDEGHAWRGPSSGEAGQGRNYSPEVQRHYGYGANRTQDERGAQRIGQGSQLGTQTDGPYRGHGPRGYTRSDDRIREDVCDRLTDDSMLDASEIEIEVKEGEVTLIGTVRHRGDRRRAEDLADAASGVKHVQNNLRVKNAEESGSDDKSETRQGSASAAARAGRRQ